MKYTNLKKYLIGRFLRIDLINLFYNEPLVLVVILVIANKNLKKDYHRN